MSGNCAVFVSHAFAPLNIIGAQRALRIAKVLLERYDRVYVVGLDHRQLDPRLLDFEFGKAVLDDPRLTFIPCNPLFNGFEYTRPRPMSQRIVGAICCRLFCGNGVDWMGPLGRALDAIPESEQVQLVMASGSPFISFVTVTRWAARRAAPVILDYRDLWTRNPRAPYPAFARRAMRRLVEKEVNRAATLLTTVSAGCKQTLELDASGTPVHLLLNSPDASYRAYFGNIAHNCGQNKSAAAGRPLRIVFTGNVYPECTFLPLLNALRLVPPGLRGRLEVHYYGDCSRLVRGEFERCGLTDRLCDHGMVSKEKSIEAILEADLLLSLIHTDAVASDPAVTGLMTTKVYDYFLSGNPVLNIGPVDADVNVFARSISYVPFHSFTAQDTAALAGFLERFAADNDLPRMAPNEVVMPNFADALHAIIDGVGRPGSRLQGAA